MPRKIPDILQPSLLGRILGHDLVYEELMACGSEAKCARANDYGPAAYQAQGYGYHSADDIELECTSGKL